MAQDLTDLNDIREQAALLRKKERQRHTFSWLSAGHGVAALLLLAAMGIWFRIFWFQIEPQFAAYVEGRWQTTIDMLLNGSLDLLMVVAGGIAFAVIPPLLISALIPNTPAALVLARLKVRYGWTGYLFPLIGGVGLTYLCYDALITFWSSRPSFWVAGNPQTPDIGAVKRAAVLWTILLVGFPAWALNQLTPAQWVDTLLDSILASRIHLALDLQEEISAAIKVRAKALLYADLAMMTVEEREQNAVQVAAIQAGVLRDLRRAMQQVLRAADSRHSIAETVMPSDTAILSRHKQLASALASTADEVGYGVAYVEALGAPDRPQPSVALPIAETEASANARARIVEVPHGPRTLPRTLLRKVSFADELRVAFLAHGMNGFTRARLQETLDCEKTKASEIIASWRHNGVLRELKETRFHYAFTEEVRTWLA